MKKLNVVLKNGQVIEEYHASSQAASERLVVICKKFEVENSSISDVVRHVELREPVQKELTLKTYATIK